MQDTWKEGVNLNEEVNIFHILYNNYDIGGRGGDKLWKGVGIIFSTNFYQYHNDGHQE